MSIKFNGKDLEKLFPALYVDDITVSPIQLNPLSRQRPVSWGAEFIRMGGGTRTVEITFAVLEQDIDERSNLLQDIRDWATTSTEKNLQLPMFGNRHLECICTTLPGASYRKWWESKLKLVFTCFNNPYWTSDELIEAKAGAVFSIGGSAPPLMTIERNGSTKLTNQTFATASESMTFTEIPAGKLVIDLNRQTAAIGKTSIMNKYKPSSTWIIPKVGANQYINGVGTVRYRERWV